MQARDTLFVRCAAIEEAPLSADLMLFDPGTSRFFVLNPTMALVWRQCDGQHTLSSMLDAIRVEFDDADPATVEHDVRKAVNELEMLGLITPASSGI